MWRVNPDGHEAFLKMGGYAYLLMIVVGTACAAAAVGLWKRREWGRRLAIGILLINLMGDTAGAVIRHDYRTLIGLPIGGAMIAYLLRVGSFSNKGVSVWNTD